MSDFYGLLAPCFRLLGFQSIIFPNRALKCAEVRDFAGDIEYGNLTIRCLNVSSGEAAPAARGRTNLCYRPQFEGSWCVSISGSAWCWQGQRLLHFLVEHCWPSRPPARFPALIWSL